MRYLLPLLLAVTLRAGVVSDTNFLDRLYLDVLNRSPGPPDLSFGLTYLGTPGDTRQGLALYLLGSNEYRGDLVTSYYQSYLSRTPQTSDVNAFLTEFTGGATDEQVQAQILGSLEYFGDTGGTNAQYITALYLRLLGRMPSGTDVSNWQTFLATQPRQDMATNLLGSAEYLDLLVGGYYQSYLNRIPSSFEFSPFVNQIQGGGTNELVQSEILGSTEFYADAQPAAVPEPASYYETAAAVALLWLVRRRRTGPASRHSADPGHVRA
jgi:hypothetical protein